MNHRCRVGRTHQAGLFQSRQFWSDSKLFRLLRLRKIDRELANDHRAGRAMFRKICIDRFREIPVTRLFRAVACGEGE